MTFLSSRSAIIGVHLYLFVFTLCQNLIFAQDLMCCSHAKGTCRNVCEKISLVELAADSALRNQTLYGIKKYCSPELASFWECLNATFKDMSRGESWTGRVCCPVPYSDSCRRACITARSSLDLAQGCRKSDEIEFFSCLEKQEEGERCCGNARTDDCRDACGKIFRNDFSSTDAQRYKVRDACERTSPMVYECVQKYLRVTPPQDFKAHMHCCDKTNKSKCRDTCKKVLSVPVTVQEMIDGMQNGGCGYPLLQDIFWQCLLQEVTEEESSIERAGIDSAKWHCCQHATTQQCQTLCSKTYTKFWATSWNDFQSKCLNHMSEESLRSCLNEVDEPCELGCDGLSFCTNFNNRPTELFRSCSLEADDAARNEVAKWQNQNELYLPDAILPLKNITKCSPDTWKTIACTLQIQPCSRDSHANQICWDVCIDVLSKCIDWTRAPNDISAEIICSTLSPEDSSMPCIDLKRFMKPAENNYQRLTAQVSSPCRGDPCGSDEICIVNRNAPSGANYPYKCVPGCKMGEASEYLVPDGTYVKIPITNKKGNKSHLKICKCKKHAIDECKPLLPVTLTSCLMGNTHRLHGTVFNMDCNVCNCFAGELICTLRQCNPRDTAVALQVLPCNCPQHYVPVCGKNGLTYTSACLAKCHGLSDSDIDFAPCEDPCSKHKCSIGHKCVPNPQVCLSLQRSCLQYQCISGTAQCNRLPEDPVCDTDNREYANSCLLVHHNAKFAYKGPCLRHCNFRGTVCGINGRTYISECAAHADMVSVDYQGSCIAVGLVSDKKSHQCSTVKCQSLATENCMGITPPGACCPVCGGALRLLYSQKQIDRALYILNKTTEPVSLQTMLKSLQRQIQVAQCVLRGYLTMERDIFVIVQSSERFPSELQMEACVREAEKIGNLIRNQNPRIVSELSLSCLTGATVVHGQANHGNVLYNNNFTVCVYMMFISYLITYLLRDDDS